MKILCKHVLLVTSVIMANAIAMIPDIKDASSAKKMLEAATNNLHSANSELQKAEDSRMRLEIDYDTKSKNWKRDIKSVSDGLISQLKLINTIDRQAIRQAVVVEALQKIILLLTNIENLQQEIEGKEDVSQRLLKANNTLAQNMELVQKNIEALTLSSKENKDALQKEVKNLENSLKSASTERSKIIEQVKQYKSTMRQKEKELQDQLKNVQSAALKQEAALVLENQELLTRLQNNQKLNKEEIAKLNLNIALLTSRLESNRARADQNWLELEKLKLAQEKSTRANPITRFFNWVRGRKQQGNQ